MKCRATNQLAPSATRAPATDSVVLVAVSGVASATVWMYGSAAAEMLAVARFHALSSRSSGCIVTPG